MRTHIVDDREHNWKLLSQIDFGQHFIYSISNEEKICTRISTDLKVGYSDEKLLVMDEGTGELFCINRDALVEPVKAEIHIVE